MDGSSDMSRVPVATEIIKRLVFLILVVSGGEVEWSIHGYWSGAFT
ncbi:unnamed protein product, partial [Brassica oleracea var. botrytis]